MLQYTEYYMSKEFFKKYKAVILVGGFLMLFNLFMVVWYVLPAGPDQWNADVVPGKVVSMSETILITQGPRGNTKTFLITPETQIFAGKKQASSALLTPGTMVLVEKRFSTSTEAVAQEIRIITDKRKGKPNQ